ncbi:MAG: endo alpha-1,4 polygalactosaminidase [Balneolaceae bacterium]|nr:endo alpha-1,4 polygalactosaminidase [Balneolaceae bacterium]MBO6546689.1 endo alpha-1,4 polygalactosaminidase [Balneolaceae bacterium]MBO6649047.1 endo alpha-1,4 polygalactosaminidase [Balneolaceae bacterium]
MLRSKSIALFTVLLMFSNMGCAQIRDSIDYKEEMRNFVEEISEYGRNQNPDFIVIPQNGVQLVSDNGKWNGKPDRDYLEAIDGLGQESLYYGSYGDDIDTPLELTDYLQFYLDIGKEAGKAILVTDYTSVPNKMDSSYEMNEQKEYISFAADDRELTTIPDYPEQIKDENPDPVTTLTEAENFLYLLNPEEFGSKQDFLDSIAETNYGVIIIDAFYMGTILTNEDLTIIRSKADGAQRLIISYMSIGEAEDYRYYWQENWEPGNPDWIVAENPNWEGNYKVKYWEQGWKSYIYGNQESYLQKIIDAGFDGVYLDIIDAFYYFEQLEN